MSDTSLPDASFVAWVQYLCLYTDLRRKAEHLHSLKSMSDSQRYVQVSSADSAIRHCHQTLLDLVPFTRMDSAYVGFLGTHYHDKLGRGIVTEAEYWEEFLRFAVDFMA